MAKKKVSPEVKAEILGKLNKGSTPKELADEYGIKTQKIYQWNAQQKVKTTPNRPLRLKKEKESSELDLLKTMVHVGFKKKLIEPNFYNSIRYMIGE